MCVKDFGADMEDLPDCPACGSKFGDCCRTPGQKVGKPPCPERLVLEVRKLRLELEDKHLSVV